MKSPFPGMDPYLEARWPGVHGALITLITESLQPQLPPQLRARGEERILLEGAGQHDGPISDRPDVAVVEVNAPFSRTPASNGASLATIEPIRIKFRSDPEVDHFIHIIDITDGNRIVTAIEILGPSNKHPSRPNEDYRQKLQEYDDAQINVVEIDLLRNPSRDYLQVTNSEIPRSRRAPYMICINNAGTRGEWLAYPISLRDPLPSIPIPLRPQDAPVTLDLQPLIERAYVIGGHDDIDYTKPPKPPLEGQDALWAATLLQASRS